MKKHINTIMLCMACIFLSCLYFQKGGLGVPQGGIILASSDGSALNHTIDKQSPPCLQMHYSIEKHAKTYQIPLNYAYGIAYAETRYGGPFDWEYDQSQESYAGAIGPMQIMPATSEMMWPKEQISRSKLMNDIDFNVMTSMKLLRHLYNRYHDWKIVFGCYNTGRPCINDYAIQVYNYKPNFK